MNKTFKEYEEENTIICPNCNVKIKTNIIPMNFFDNIHEDMYISHEAEYLERKKLQNKIDKAIKCIEYYALENEDYSKSYNEEEQNLLKILKGEDNEI